MVFVYLDCYLFYQQSEKRWQIFKKSSNEDIALLNKYIQWQLNNKMCGLCFKVIDPSNAKLFVFVDGSFTNNKD